MKKILLSIVLLFSAFMITGCMGINEFKDVSIEIKEGTLSATGATIVLTNHSNQEYTYGEEYKIEKKEGFSWKELTCEDCWFNSYANILGANEEVELDCNFESYFGKLEKGTYRLTKSVRQEDNTEKNISVEFVID